MTIKTIYIADDEKKIRDLISLYLTNEGYHVIGFKDGYSLLLKLTEKIPDMVILDIMMPGINGYDVCKEIRKKSNIPIIMVSAKDEPFDKILGIELGSDDYLAKPFSPRELVARVKNIFKRIGNATKIASIESNQLTVKDITIYNDQRKVINESGEILLTTKEFDLLLFLIENKNKVFNRSQLIDHVWGYEYVLETRLVDDVIKRIRKKLKDMESKLEITTVWGYGYKVEE